MNTPGINQNDKSDFSQSGGTLNINIGDNIPLKAEFGTDHSVIKQISSDFHQSGGTFNVRISKVIPLEADFGLVYAIQQDGKVLYATTETWENQPKLIAKSGYIYIYSDWKKDGSNNDIPGAKIGDGTRYLKDLPFTMDVVYQHIGDTKIHITQSEREFWNNKERAYISGSELVFTKQ